MKKNKVGTCPNCNTKEVYKEKEDTFFLHCYGTKEANEMKDLYPEPNSLIPVVICNRCGTVYVRP